MEVGKNKIIILGSGHLALRAKNKFQESGYGVQRVPLDFLQKTRQDRSEIPKFEAIQSLLKQTDFNSAKAVYILNDDDSVNIELSLIVLEISPDAAVYVSLFNKPLGDYLGKLHKSLHVFNPAAISAPYFADILEGGHEDSDFDLSDIFEPLLQKSRFNFDKTLTALLAVFALFYGTWVTFFKYVENLSWIDSFYFTAVTISTLGYEDAGLRNLSASSKIFAALIILSSMIFVGISFSFFIDWLLKKRREIELGRRKYKLHDHAIICGLGRMGYQLAEELIRRGKKVLAIESNDDGKFLELAKAKGIKILIGDAVLSKNLKDAGIEKAAGVFVMVEDDIKNLEIGLTAMSLKKNNMPIILRIFDEELAKKARKQLKFSFAFSTTAITADYLVKKLK